MQRRRESTTAWAKVGAGFVTFIQRALWDYQRDRDWWMDAPPERVLRVIAARMLCIAFGLLVIAGAVLLYARAGQFPGARAVAATVAALSGIALLFSARRLGESLVLAGSLDDGGQRSLRARSFMMLAVLAGGCGWAWCGYSLMQGQIWGIQSSREPITFAAIGGLSMFVSTYALATCARALGVLLSPASVHDTIRQKLNGRSWTWIKNFETLDQD